MDNRQIANASWEIDPRHLAQSTYDDIERLFLAAYSATFCFRASPDRVYPYLVRYIRSNVVPPWVSGYVCQVHDDEAAKLLAAAELDSRHDWRHIMRWLEFYLPLIYIPRDAGSSCPGRFLA